MESVATFNWAEELESTVVKSLTTSFGLDFLLFEDKRGGDVDTIHNVRQSIWATKSEKSNYENRSEYNSSEYHSHENYKQRGRDDKKIQLEENLADPYRNKTMARNENRDLDHVQSAHEIHNDAGRVLAGLNGVELANKDSNLVSTNSSINRSKNAKPITVFIADLDDNISRQKIRLQKQEMQLLNMPKNTPEQQHKYRAKESSILAAKNKIKEFESIDKQKMIQADEKARIAYNQEINKTYYTSSKFLGNAANDAVNSGFKMGSRQMLGLIMAEIWFELRSQIPIIKEAHQSNFQIDKFLISLQETIKNIWNRVASRFNEFLISFKDGVFSGALSSATTTLLNIFATSEKMVVKMIREMWSSLIQAFKLIALNPQKLSTVELIKAVSNILSVGVATLFGTMIYSYLLPILNFPFGSEIAGFISAIATGLITLSFQYFLNYSEVMKKVWNFIKEIENSNYSLTLENFQLINTQLDDYLKELSRLEFNFDLDELNQFSNNLMLCNTELEKTIVLKREIEKRNIELPFEMGNSNSTKSWLLSLADK
jgi:hypothetical protein